MESILRQELRVSPKSLWEDVHRTFENEVIEGLGEVSLARVSSDVAQKRPNSFGLFDMLGNAAEWVSDWYGENYYQDSPSLGPVGPDVDIRRVLRGGSFLDNAQSARPSSRSAFYPDRWLNILGFRCARDMNGDDPILVNTQKP